jgi:DNA-binding NtrC family response regulator
LEDIKCKAVMDALARNKGKKMQTCRELGISKDTLRRMLARCSQASDTHKHRNPGHKS